MNFQTYHIPPMDNSSGHSPQKLSGTGTAESHNISELTPGRDACLQVGAVPIYVSFRRAPNLTNQVDAALHLRLPAGALFLFRTIQGKDHGSTFVYVEAADGASAYTADVWLASE